MSRADSPTFVGPGMLPGPIGGPNLRGRGGNDVMGFTNSRLTTGHSQIDQMPEVMGTSHSTSLDAMGSDSHNTSERVSVHEAIGFYV